MSTRRFDREVIVVGGGPAGLAAGIALRSQNIDCLVVDSRVPPVDKACGEGLMPDSLLSLSQMGVQITPAHGAAFTGIRFTDGLHSVEARFPNGIAVGIKRTELHNILVRHAETIGVSLVWNETVRILDLNTVQIGDNVITCRWLVGADGQGSNVRRVAGLDEVSQFEQRYGFRRHYKVPYWTEFVEVHWGPSGQLYITPISKDEICVALVTRFPQMRIDNVLPEFPFLQEKLCNADITSPERGAVTTTRQLKSVVRDNVALIGDASGSVDAVTGEGMAVSFRQSIAMASAIKNNDLSKYQSIHEEIARLPRSMANVLLLLDRYHFVRSRALSALQAAPGTFDKLLAVHVGHQSLGGFLFNEAPKFGWRLIFA